ncbi:MAG: CDP-alcohol phosphatidyltransferase family protein [bacterium]|nr:CDP-alcohol phosphatidyltransferase family protein [bacterium]MCP5065903.1 CDP-alcohol phosphatidyltransferase family protein [bacterium]
MASPAPSAPARWRTRANVLTVLRLAAAPPLVLAICQGQTGLAHALFWMAVATDLLDGRVARRYGEASPMGGIFDHATDAIFVSAGLLAVAWRGEVSIWLPALVVAAFVQYAADSRALAGRPLRASLLGRWNGIAYFVLLGIPVVRDGFGLGWPPGSWVVAIGWALIVTTLVSMGDRFLALVRNPSPS